MKKSKKKLNESITESSVSPLGYIIFIDASSCVASSRNSYLKIMFSSESTDSIKNWFKPLTNAKVFNEIKDKLEAIGSRFSNNPSLKALFNSLAKLKSSSYPEQDKESHENDIELIIKRISIYIKRKLTEEDIKVIETIIEELNVVVQNISKKIDDEISLLATKAEEKPEEEPKKKEKQKTEIKVNERVKNKLRKKIKEMVRSYLLAKK